jgi:hypothetical protein
MSIMVHVHGSWFIMVQGQVPAKTMEAIQHASAAFVGGQTKVKKNIPFVCPSEATMAAYSR